RRPRDMTVGMTSVHDMSAHQMVLQLHKCV
ncbi:hypothetical protein L195_g027717, partial [Trifolium pratense]